MVYIHQSAMSWSGGGCGAYLPFDGRPSCVCINRIALSQVYLRIYIHVHKGKVEETLVNYVTVGLGHGCVASASFAGSCLCGILWMVLWVCRLVDWWCEVDPVATSGCCGVRGQTLRGEPPQSVGRMRWFESVVYGCCWVRLCPGLVCR